MKINLANINPVFIIAAVLVVVLISVVVFILLSIIRRGKKISTRMDQFVASENPPAGEVPLVRSIIPREIAGSLFNRTVVNWFSKIFEQLGKLSPNRLAIATEHKLKIAGNPGNLHAGTFFGVRVMLLVVGLLLALLLNRDLGNISSTSLIIGILIIVIFMVIPSLWLSSQVRSRQDEIQRGLPDALDMLSVCASAGLGLDQSIQKISSYWDTELGREFSQVIREMKMGVPRAEALTNLSDRLDVSDLSQFIIIIVQAEKIGMSYADVLHSQALQLRVLRQLRAREIANKLPGKMMIPVVLFIFPAIMAVILGPTLPVLIDLF